MGQIRDFLQVSDGPIVISGPCSAESLDQMRSIALTLAATGRVHALRAGVWKPRTRPGSFEGMGSEALSWLVGAGAESGLPVFTEVALPIHVEQAMKAGITAFWIGARTVANPFSVSELAQAFSGTDLPILIKNPLNADPALWIGAIERFEKAGLGKLAAVHRGFSMHGPSKFRNVPLWEIPIGIRTAMPGLEMFCDPSHIAGKRDLVATIAQYALDLGFDGLMIESHPTPELALSDSEQQLSPSELTALLSGLIPRGAISNTKNYVMSLNALRSDIDRIDFEIVRLLSQRMAKAEELGMNKKENNIAIFQMERWREIVKSRSEWASEMELSSEFMVKVLEQIHTESLRIQNAVLSGRQQPY